VRIRNPGWASDISKITSPVSDCKVDTIKFWHPGDRLSSRILEELQASYGYTLMGFVSSPFDFLQTNTLHTYFYPSFYYLERRPLCNELASVLVPAVDVGSEIVPDKLSEGSVWKNKGAFPNLGYGNDQLIHDFWGSWAGSDSTVGSFEYTVLGVCHDFVIPILTGPVSKRQSVSVLFDGNVKFEFQGSIPNYNEGWGFLKVVVAEGCHTIKVIGTDSGENWGEWMALGFLREFKKGSEENE
jgi:hypothetical protein